MSGEPSFSLPVQTVAIDKGKATGGSATTLRDETKSWDTNVLANFILFVRGRGGGGNARVIASNTANTITVVNAFSSAPDNGAEYEIYLAPKLDSNGNQIVVPPANSQFPVVIQEASATATAGSATLVAATAAKKTRIYCITLSLEAVGAVAASATVNEATSGTILAQLHTTGLAGENTTMSKVVVYPPQGGLQPTANNAIQVTATGASCIADAELVFSAAE